MDMEEDLIAEEANFWKEYVQKKIEPPYIEKPDLVLESIRRHYGPAEKDSETVKLSPKHLQSVNQYLNWKEQRAEAEKEVKRLEEEMKKSYLDIVEELGPNCTGKISSGNKEYMISYNPMYRVSIDKKALERLKIQRPDIYDDYVSVSESRRFSVKIKEAA